MTEYRVTIMAAGGKVVDAKSEESAKKLAHADWANELVKVDVEEVDA